MREKIEIDQESAEELLARQERLVAFVEEFVQDHDIDGLSADEIDLWLERLRPIRLEMRAIDDVLRQTQTGS